MVGPTQLTVPTEPIMQLTKPIYNLVYTVGQLCNETEVTE